MVFQVTLLFVRERYGLSGKGVRSMAKRARRMLIEERLVLAGLLVTRARIFYDIWWFYARPDIPEKTFDTMDEYSEFVTSDRHAHLVAFIVHIDNLFSQRGDTVNLPNLVSELATLVPANVIANAKALLAQVQLISPKISVLRNNLFAHRSAILSDAEVFQKASISHSELRDLTEIALQIVNCLLVSRRCNEQMFHVLPRQDIEAMFGALTKISAT